MFQIIMQTNFLFYLFIWTDQTFTDCSLYCHRHYVLISTKYGVVGVSSIFIFEARFCQVCESLHAACHGTLSFTNMIFFLNASKELLQKLCQYVNALPIKPVRNMHIITSLFSSYSWCFNGAIHKPTFGPPVRQGWGQEFPDTGGLN